MTRTRAALLLLAIFSMWLLFVPGPMSQAGPHDSQGGFGKAEPAHRGWGHLGGSGKVSVSRSATVSSSTSWGQNSVSDQSGWGHLGHDHSGWGWNKNWGNSGGGDEDQRTGGDEPNSPPPSSVAEQPAPSVERQVRRSSPQQSVSSPSTQQVAPADSVAVLRAQEPGPSVSPVAISKERPAAGREKPPVVPPALRGELVVKSGPRSETPALRVTFNPLADWLGAPRHSRWWVEYVMVLAVIGLVLFAVRYLPATLQRLRF
jgi:hypothetical protein